jgi:hypothetical protein
MTLPTLDKTWIFKTNQVYITSGNRDIDFPNLWFMIKQLLTDGAGWTDNTGAPTTNSHLWTVSGSSNGSIADTADNWNAYTDLVWNTDGVAHSWIVLRQPEINPLYEICLECASSTTRYNFSFHCSPVEGFDLTSPSTLNNPVATDLLTLASTAQYLGTTAAFSCTLGCAMSTDGECTRLWVFWNGTCHIFWIFDKPKNPVVGWANPSITLAVPLGGSNPVDYTNLNDNPRIYSRGKDNRVMSLYASTEFYVDAAIGQRLVMANQITEEWPMCSMGLVSATPGTSGRNGEIYDMWFTATAISPGVSAPSTGPRSFVCMGDIFVPWDQSDLITNV